VKFGYPGLTRIAQLGFTVEAADYSIENLKVDSKFVDPGKKALARIRREQKELKAIYQKITRKKYWNGPFVLPVNSATTSPYGGKRMYNGELRSFHSGLDLKAAVGVPITAPAPGVVVLAKDLYFTGGTVVLDHGYGVFTIYAHLSKVGVKVGKKVEQREILGLAGATGRVSGPHLHWTTQVSGVKVNPTEFVRVVQ
jgi:murein DD-endopeptidase MepM/ murein hydrolase activator NlpD